jgi:hypothetical protein
MTKQHRATPEQWAQIERTAQLVHGDGCSAILELRARIEALEVTQQPNAAASLASSPAGSLVERVGNRIPLLPDGRVDDASARAAILEVAAAAKERIAPFDPSLKWGDFAQWLEREASR